MSRPTPRGPGEPEEEPISWWWAVPWLLPTGMIVYAIVHQLVIDPSAFFR